MNELRVGLIGAGIFARDAHVPAWLALQGRARVVAVWSRTRASAEACAALLPGHVEIEENIGALLARQDIDAVDIVLPIDAQPDVVEMALAAGKHVISEKPIAASVQRAQALIEAWRPTGRVWMVAENYRYERTWRKVAELVHSGALGRPLSLTWALYAPMTPAVKYYHTPWRFSGQVGGGFVVDGGVHHMAVVRMVMGEVAAVKAIAAHQRRDLPAPDTISSALEFESGALGHYFVTFAARPGVELPLVVAGTEGILRAQREWVEVVREDGVARYELPGRNGVEAEIEAFVAAVMDGAPHDNAPQQALRDLTVITTMLQSAEEGGVRVVSVASD